MLMNFCEVYLFIFKSCADVGMWTSELEIGERGEKLREIETDRLQLTSWTETDIPSLGHGVPKYVGS